jgi:hypothetical protein
VAIFKKAGYNLDIALLDEGARCNKDGAGYAYVRDGRVEIHRSVRWDNLRTQYMADVAKYGKTSHFLIHFRIATHGPVVKDNCHPFRLEDGAAFIHNGIIPVPNSEIPEDWSDTRWFVSEIMDTLPVGWQDSVTWTTMLGEMIGHSKAVTLWPNGDYLISNESSGHWETEDGYKSLITADDEHVWFSNYSCSLPKAATPTRTPTAHTGTGGNFERLKAGDPEPLHMVGHLDPVVWKQVGPASYTRRNKEEQEQYKAMLNRRPFIELMLSAGVCPGCEREFSNESRLSEHVATCDAAQVMAVMK